MGSTSLWDSFYKPHHLLCLGFTEEARAEIRKTKDRFSFYFRYRDGWYEHLFNYYVGQIDSDRLLQRAGNSQWNLCEGHYAIGMMKLSEGRRAEAKRHFQESVNTRVYWFVEYVRSRAFLKRLERDPNWPPWIPVKEGVR